MTAINMLRLDNSSPDFGEQLKQRLAWDASDDLDIHQRVLEIIANVRKNGDQALVDYTNRFDRTAFKAAAELELSPAALKQVWDSLPEA
jgi:histidinol dehydrogenase